MTLARVTKSNPENTTFNSTYFVAFDLMHTALKAGLKAASNLSITQYRILVRLLSDPPQSVEQAEIRTYLRLKPNVVTQALDALEQQGFVNRERSERDGRTRAISITEAGIEHVSKVNESIVVQLYDRFPTHSHTFRHILEASITAGATIDPSLSEETVRRFPASRTLVAFEFISHMMEEGLRKACGASFSECRIMQRLDEEGNPLRIGDIAKRLQMSPTNVARATDRLVQRGWVQRMGVPNDKKAVFVVVTEEGIRQQAIITRTIDELAQRQLWEKLDKVHRNAIAQVASVVFADIQAKKEAEHQAMLSLLQPL